MTDSLREIAGIMGTIAVAVILGAAAIAGAMVPRDQLHRVWRKDDDDPPDEGGDSKGTAT